jgi:transcriptional regulator GlxA family with amidase domain
VRSSQSPFVDETLVPVSHARFSDDVRGWLRHHLAEPYQLDRLAAAVHVSSRTLLRRFRAETGESPLTYLQRTRIAAAKRLLETSDLSVDAILGHVGYHDAATFRRLFAGLVGMTPSQYRRLFRPAPTSVH